MKEFKAALVLVWFAVTLVTGASAAAPFLLPAEAIARMAPVCESKRLYGRECVLCGTTTAFIAIGRWDWSGAARSNRLAIPLFAVFVANAAGALTYFTLRLRNGTTEWL